MRSLACLVIVAACSGKSSAPQGQSYAEAMKIVCDGAGKDPAYFKANLTNTEVITFMSAIGDVNPAERAQRMHDAVAKAGLTSCPYFETPGGVTSIPMPTVPPDTGLAQLPEAPALIISQNAIVVEGQSIVAVRNGDIDPADKEGGAMGIKITRLAVFMKALVDANAAKAPTGPPLRLNLIVDPATPYKLLMAAMFSAKSGPIRTFALAVRAGTATKAIVIELPDTTAVDAEAAQIKMVVAITKSKVLLWSLSGQEGTLDKPKLDVPLDRIAELRKALVEIADRRWPGGTGKETAIVVMADGDVPVQTVAEVMAAAKPVFPDVRLSSGFQ